jgi:hypothetical protein
MLRIKKTICEKCGHFCHCSLNESIEWIKAHREEDAKEKKELEEEKEELVRILSEPKNSDKKKTVREMLEWVETQKEIIEQKNQEFEEELADEIQELKENPLVANHKCKCNIKY